MLSRSSQFELITQVELGSNGLLGTVPSEIFQLLSLEVLDLSKNKIDLRFDDIGQPMRLDQLFERYRNHFFGRNWSGSQSQPP